MSLLLTPDQLAAGFSTLEQGKLGPSQISDLLSIFRGYLGDLADDYPIQATLEAEDDLDGLGRRRCEKLAACLLLFQDDQFTPTSGFAPTAGNRTGFIYAADEEVYTIFQYAFGLFWNLPKELLNKWSNNGRGLKKSLQGRTIQLPSASGRNPMGIPFGNIGGRGGT